MLTRRGFLANTAALAAARAVNPLVAQANVHPGGREQRPNILIFMPDQTQGQAILPGSPCHTPNVQRLAAQGVMFNNAFCPAPHCCPSRASFMTGLYPSEHGVFNNVDTDTAIHANPYPGTRYFAEYLRQAGYQLDYSGKWHVGRNVTPQDAGWTASYAQNAPKAAESFVPGEDRRNSTWAKAHAEMRENGPRQPGEVFRPGWGNLQFYKTLPSTAADPFAGMQSDVEPIESGKAKLKRLSAFQQPWALMVSNSGSHDRYIAPKHFVDMYDPASIALPANFRDTLADKPRIYQRMRYQYWSQLSDGEIREAIAHYWAKTTMQDALFGQLLDTLEQTGQADNTIVIYVSDHGDYAGAHGLWAKGVPSFREAYNIPAVIRWPRGIAHPGRSVDALVSTTDFAPTILEAAGIPASQYTMSGQSLMPWLRGERPTGWRDALFTQMNGVELYYTQRIVMTRDYKYVYNGFDFDELYDRRDDPHEMKNLAFPDVEHARAMVEAGKGDQDSGPHPWPPLRPQLEEVRRDLLDRMWLFAQQHRDQIFNQYITVALAPYGPGLAL
jgi:arylsulfatase A-like enzyme